MTEKIDFAAGLNYEAAKEYLIAEDREYADYLLAMIGREKRPNWLDIYSKFFQQLEKEIGSDQARDTQLHHILIGDSISNEDWQSFKFDTENKDFQRFISELISGETEKQSRQEERSDESIAA